MTTTATKPAPNGTAHETHPETKDTLNLWQRIRSVQAEAANIPKNGTAPAEMGGFAFVRDTDVSDAARELYTRHGIAYIVSMIEDGTEEAGQTRAGKTIYRTRVVVEITLRNVDEPSEREVIRWSGFGDDMGDKGLGKAGTSAVKNALTKLLLIGGEPSHDIDATDATGGEGRDGAEARLGRCSKCGGGFYRKEKKNGQGHYYQCRGKVNGAWCNSFPDRDVQRQMEAGEEPQRSPEDAPDAREDAAPPGELTLAQLAMNVVARLSELISADEARATAVMTAHGWDGRQASAPFVTSRPGRPALLALASDINSALREPGAAAAQTEINP